MVRKESELIEKRIVIEDEIADSVKNCAIIIRISNLTYGRLLRLNTKSTGRN